MSDTPMIKKFAEDEVIIREGEKYDEMYKLLSGRAAIYLHYGEESEYLLGIVSSQKCFGEVSLFSSKPSPYTVVALSDTMVMRITKEQFESFIVENPRNVIDIMTNMANRIIMLNTNLDMISDELAEFAARIEKTENSSPEFFDISEKIMQYKLAALTGKNHLT